MSEEPSWSGRSGRRETRWCKEMSDHPQLSFQTRRDQALEHISQTRLFQTIHIILIQDQMWPDYSTFSRKYWKFIGSQLKVFQWNFRIAYPWTCVVMVLIVILTKTQFAAQQHDGCGPDVGQRQRSSSWFSVPHSSRLWGSGWFFVMSRVFLHFVGIFSWSGLHVGLLGVAHRKHVIDRDIEVWHKVMDNINKKRFCPSLPWTF